MTNRTVTESSSKQEEQHLVFDTVFGYERESPGFIQFFRETIDGFTRVTAKEFAEEVRAVAKGLLALGPKVSNRVAIKSATSNRWP